MRKIIWLMHGSLDGFASGPNGELDWAGAGMDDELWEDVREQLDTVDAALFGRVTYQAFESYWPGVASNPSSAKDELDFSRWINRTPKFVASRTLKQLGWRDSELLTGDIVESLTNIKGQPGKDLLLFGSPGLASHLWRAGLIDELRMDMHPVVLGAGRPLLNEVAGRRLVSLVGSKVLRSGVVVLRYNIS